jgi:hypothetical protein
MGYDAPITVANQHDEVRVTVVGKSLDAITLAAIRPAQSPA